MCLFTFFFAQRKQDLSKSATGNKVDEHLAYLEFHGKINYIYTMHECNFVCQCIVERYLLLIVSLALDFIAPFCRGEIIYINLGI